MTPFTRTGAGCETLSPGVRYCSSCGLATPVEAFVPWAEPTAIEAAELRPEVASLVGPSRFLREIAPGRDGVLFYVMPLAEESLGARLARGPLTLVEAARSL